MSRKEDVDRFYEILEALEEKTGGKTKLKNSDGYMNWPERGVYFFFANDEWRDSGDNLRLTRVGTHAVSKGSSTTLWDRLKMHMGTRGGGDEEFMEEQLEAVNEIFRKNIAENRDLGEQDVDEIFEGKPYLGRNAKEAGLVDRLGGRDKAIKVSKELLGVEEIEVVDYGEKMREESVGLMGKVIKKFFG